MVRADGPDIDAPFPEDPSVHQWPHFSTELPFTSTTAAAVGTKNIDINIHVCVYTMYTHMCTHTHIFKVLVVSEDGERGKLCKSKISEGSSSLADLQRFLGFISQVPLGSRRTDTLPLGFSSIKAQLFTFSDVLSPIP